MDRVVLKQEKWGMDQDGIIHTGLEKILWQDPAPIDHASQPDGLVIPYISVHYKD